PDLSRAGVQRAWLGRGTREMSVAAPSGRLRRFGIGVFSLLLAAAVWIPSLHLFFRPKLESFRQHDAIAPRAQQLANRHLHLWEDPAARDAEVARMRSSNAEWDFMGRTFLVLSLANMALDEPAQRERYLKVIDAILDETTRLEREK